MAGAIHFYTKKNSETKVSTTFGNYGVRQTSASFGINDEKIDLNVSMDSHKHDGFHKAATGGVKDKGEQTKSNIGGTYTTDGGTEISLNLYRTNSDIRYPNYLSDAQFEADPTGNGSGSRYTYRDAESSTTNFKIKRNWGENFEFTTNRSAIDKESRNFYSYSGATVDNYKYDYKSNDYLLTYTNGDIIIEHGNLSDFLDLALMNFGRKELNFFSYLINRLRGSYRYLTNFNFIKKSKMNVSHHYDISDDLYDLFLDPKRQYSCAYFKDVNDSLEAAQNNKIQHIIKKLNIKSNQKVLDIGCGWGSLAIDIAKSANCEVTGITLSENQFNYCNKKAKELNLENQLTFKLVDYRELNEKFDRIVSVGMFEHVGRKFYKKFFKQIDKLLNDDGVSLIHTIGSVNPPRAVSYTHLTLPTKA